MGATDIYRWGRLGGFSSELVDYISSYGQDKEILREVVDINKAHVVSLFASGLLERETASRILKALSEVTEDELDKGPAMEDIHMAIEDYVIKKAGEAGEFINLGKSRNDQVATAIRMRLRDYIVSMVGECSLLVLSLVNRAREYSDAVMPGFTHLQPAQPVTLGYVLLAHAEALMRGLYRLIEAYNRVDLMPMGAGALAGSTVKISRVRLARLLGFKNIVENSIDAVSSRDFMIESLSAALTISLEVCRLAEHVVLWSSQQFKYIELPDEYCSTSSVMPQKKNPVVPELARAKSLSPLYSVVAIAGILKSQVYAYNLDLQEATRYLWPAVKDVLDTLRIMRRVVDGFKANRDRMLKDAENYFVVATDIAEHLTLKYNVSFRKSHKIVGELIRRVVNGELEWGPGIKEELEKLVERETGSKISLDHNELRELMDVNASLRRRSHVKIAGQGLERLLNDIEARVRRALAWRDIVIEELKKSKSLLEERVEKITGGG